MKYLCPKEVAAQFGISERTVRRMMAAGHIQAFRIGAKLWRTDQASLAVVPWGDTKVKALFGRWLKTSLPTTGLCCRMNAGWRSGGERCRGAPCRGIAKLTLIQ